MTIKAFNKLSKVEKTKQLMSCCGSSTWVDLMLQQFPFGNEMDLIDAANDIWYNQCNSIDWLESFSHHPQIGDIKSLTKKLKEQGLTLEVSESALSLLADLGYEPQFGARPLKRVIQKEIVNELAKLLLGGELVKDGTILLDTDAKGFLFNGKSTGIVSETQSDRKKRLDDLTKAAKDVEDAAKDVGKK